MLQCAQCGADIEADSKFCNQCGHKTSGPTCVSCETENSPGSKFCRECGSNLNAEAAPPPDPFANLPTVRPTEDRLQVVTILFADVKGFTALSEKLSPDQVKYIMDHILGSLTEHIEQENGYIDKYMGDCIMAIFGAHTPSADDAYRAVKAALKMQQTLREMSRALENKTGYAVQMRIGINSGKVMVGSVAKGREKDFTVMGDAVNLAQRLESNCPVGSILISASTRRQVMGSFHLNRMPPMMVKGKSEPVNTYEVLGGSPVDFGAQAAEFEGVRIPLVGRDIELDRLKEIFRSCIEERSSKGVFVIGEQGIGKSALAFELVEYFDQLDQDVTVFTGRPDPTSPTSAHSTMIDILRRRFDIRAAEEPAQGLEKLQAGLDRLMEFVRSGGSITQELGDDIQWIRKNCEIFFANLLSVGHLDHPLVKQVSSINGARSKMMTTLFRDLLELCSHWDPIFVLIDNAHQLNQDALSKLVTLQRSLASSPVFFVLLGRQEILEDIDEDIFDDKSDFRLEIPRLEPEEAQVLLDRILRPLENAGEFPFATVIERSLGVPYYLLETCHLLTDLGSLQHNGNGFVYTGGAQDEVGIPDTVTSLLQARLSTLSKGSYALLQRAAIVGQTFWWSIAQSPEITEDDLTELIDREFISRDLRSNIPMEKEFSFRSLLVWEICRGTVPENRRRSIHREVCVWLAERPIESSLGMTITLAHHREAAGMMRECFDACIHAASLALETDNFATAAELYEQADGLRYHRDIFEVFSDDSDNSQQIDATQIFDSNQADDADEVDFRIANLASRMGYIEPFVHAVVMHHGFLTAPVLDTARKYIRIARRADRSSDETEEEFEVIRTEYLCILWKIVLTYGPEVLNADEEQEVKGLLGDLSKPPLTRGRVILWDSLMNAFAMGMEHAKPYKEQLLALYHSLNTHVENGSLSQENIRYTVYRGVIRYLWYHVGDNHAALPFTARAAQVALQTKVYRDIIDSVCAFACCLIGTGEITTGARILRYLQDLEKQIGTNHAVSVNLSNEAECYMLSGYLRTAEERYHEAVALVERQGLHATHETDTYSQYAILRLYHCRDPEVDELLTRAEDMASKSDLMHVRWLRAKALSLAINFENLSQAQSQIERAKELLPNNHTERLMTDLVWLKILSAADDGRLNEEKERVQKSINGDPEMTRLWTNYEATGTPLPQPVSAEADKPHPDLQREEIEGMVLEYC